ncbi:hypothetical protein M5K25_014576 [Dendrobium thyrsiflorum]|uniref:Uncharacterized protein n=1 Tax=Dendrobium thyrsiflorum TaxID=117978 RepID=A0ABD0UNP3_DENTH
MTVKMATIGSHWLGKYTDVTMRLSSSPGEVTALWKKRKRLWDPSCRQCQLVDMRKQMRRQMRAKDREISQLNEKMTQMIVQMKVMM